MTQEFVPYQQALALKELGFDEPCFGIHYNEGLNPYFMVASQYGEHGAAANGGILAPLYQQAFRWFRKPENGSYNHLDFMYEYLKDDSITYEEAELACLIKLIEIVKQ